MKLRQYRMNEKRKSILLIGNFLSSSLGTRGISEDLRVQLIKQGWTVYYASEKTNKFARLADMLWVIYKNRNQYQAVNIDVFSGPSFIWAEASAILLNLLNKTFNLTLHGGNLAVFCSHHPIRVTRLLRNAFHVTTPSKFLKKEFQNVRSDIQWIPNGIHLRQYAPNNRTNTNPRLVWLRAFHEIYNPKMAVEVLAHLISENHNCSMIMIGPDKNDGSYKAAVETAKRENVLDRIEFVGAVKKSDVPIWLNKGDIFLNTTRIESFGVSVIEAAACGLPIVTTDAGELPYLWENEVDALIVPSGNSEAMASSVQRILNEPGLAQRLLQNARRKAERFDWSIVMPQWEKLLLEVCSLHA